MYTNEGIFQAKLPTIWTDEAEVGRVKEEKVTRQQIREGEASSEGAQSRFESHFHHSNKDVISTCNILKLVKGQNCRASIYLGGYASVSNLHLTVSINGAQAFPARLAVQFSPCSAIALSGGSSKFLVLKNRCPNWNFPQENKYKTRHAPRTCKPRGGTSGPSHAVATLRFAEDPEKPPGVPRPRNVAADPWR